MARASLPVRCSQASADLRPRGGLELWGLLPGPGRLRQAVACGQAGKGPFCLSQTLP